MNIMDTHQHRLIFAIDKDAPKNYMDRWEKFKSKCESGESGLSEPGPNKYILEQMKEYCKLEKNKKLPYLQRTEGGLGGDDNEENKQIRFRDMILWSKSPQHIDNNIIMDQITNGKNEKWTYGELDDIIYGFVNYINDQIMGCECVDGFIELKNKDYKYCYGS